MSISIPFKAYTSSLPVYEVSDRSSTACTDIVCALSRPRFPDADVVVNVVEVAVLVSTLPVY